MKKKKTILYLHVTEETKRWLKDICAKQLGRVSQSTMAERIFDVAKKNPDKFKAA